MPYKIKKVKGGEKVTSPNHPQGFSKKPQSHEMAVKQMIAIKMHDKEHARGGGKKIGIKKGK